MIKPVNNTVIPWTDIICKSAWYTSFAEIDKQSGNSEIKRYIFLPNDTLGPGLSTAIINAYNLAMVQNQAENWDGFQLIVRVGEAAGQEINRPYIELVPVKVKNDE